MPSKSLVAASTAWWYDTTVMAGSEVTVFSSMCQTSLVYDHQVQAKFQSGRPDPGFCKLMRGRSS